MTENNLKFKKNHLIILVALLVIILAVIFSQKTSTNKIVVWEQSNTGLTTLSVNTVIADVNNQSILYAGTDTGIFKSIDKGVSWVAINNGLPNPLPEIRKIVHAPYAKAIFALGVGDLFQSLDGGNNWILVGTGMADIALTPYLRENRYEKIHLIDYGITKDPIIYSISTGIGFFAEPQQETRAYIKSFFESLYKDQKEINKNNREKISRLLGKTIEDDDITYDIVRAKKIDFLQKRTLSNEEKTRVIAVNESVVSLLTQNTWPTWLHTDRTIYSCWEDFIGCEKDDFLESILEKFGPHPLNSGVKVVYSQKGIPHIYANIGSKLLVKTCLNRGGYWIVENSLEDLGVSPALIFVYSHNNDIKTYDCYDDEEKEVSNIKERTALEDVVFVIGSGKEYGQNLLLVSMDNANTWTKFESNLPTSIESLFAIEDESIGGYVVFVTTKDSGVFKTSIFFKDIK